LYSAVPRSRRDHRNSRLPGVDLLDIAGPHEIFKWMSIPVTVELVAEAAGDITTRDGLTFKAN